MWIGSFSTNKIANDSLVRSSAFRKSLINDGLSNRPTATATDKFMNKTPSGCPLTIEPQFEVFCLYCCTVGSTDTDKTLEVYENSNKRY